MITTEPITTDDVLYAVQKACLKTEVTCWPRVIDSADPNWKGADEVNFNLVKHSDGWKLHGDNGDEFKITVEKVSETC